LQADWEFEVGGDAPVIDAFWQGFVDLRVSPERVSDLPEAALLPGLAAALLRLNSEGSPVWTSKCDFWPVLEREEFDADELDAPAGCSTVAGCCYIDILPRGDHAWPLPQPAEAACKLLCALLGRVPLRCCRVDLVIRRALIAPGPMDSDRMDLGPMDFGMTAYITACGPTPAQAARTLEEALIAFADALCPNSTLQ
jgi:hypothetical protein